MAAVGSLLRAKVTRAGATGVYVKISAHYPGVEFGPCDLVANIVRVGLDPDDTQWLADLILKGDDVLVVDTGNADFLVVGTIRTSVSATGEAPS